MSFKLRETSKYNPKVSQTSKYSPNFESMAEMGKVLSEFKVHC